MEFCNREMAMWYSAWMDEKRSTTRCVHSATEQDSYDLIVPKFQKFAESAEDRELLCPRYLYTATIWISAEDVLHFADLGFKQMSVEPVVATG